MVQQLVYYLHHVSHVWITTCVVDENINSTMIFNSLKFKYEVSNKLPIASQLLKGRHKLKVTTKLNLGLLQVHTYVHMICIRVTDQPPLHG